jgi:hypothetical protein
MNKPPSTVSLTLLFAAVASLSLAAHVAKLVLISVEEPEFDNRRAWKRPL